LLNAPKADLNNDPICQNKQSNEEASSRCATR
jgi:hypothetical protein